MVLTKRSCPGTSMKEIAFAAWKLKMGETQIDGDATLLFFWAFVEGHTCQGFEQSGLAVINMPEVPMMMLDMSLTLSQLTEHIF